MSSGQPVSQQINSISRALILGLIVLSFIAIGTTLLIRSIFADYRQTARITLSANAILEDVLEARVAALQWRLTSDNAFVDEVVGNLTEVKQVEVELNNLLGPNSELADVLGELEADVIEYEKDFKILQQSQASYDGVEQNMTTSGLAARTALTEIMTSAYQDQDVAAAFYAGRAQEALMLGRYYLQVFNRTEADDDFQRMVGELSRALSELGTLDGQLQDPGRRELASLATSEIRNMTVQAQDLSTALAGIQAARSAIEAVGPKISEDIDHALEWATGLQNTLGPRGQAVAFWAVVAMAIAAATITIAGLVFAKRISAKLSSDIERAVEDMSKIADGDLETQVANAELDNEIGRMAKALEVFKTKGKAAIEAAEREKLAAEERRTAAKRAEQQQAEKDEQARRDAEAARKAMIADLSQSVGQVVSAASEGDFSRRVDAKFDDMELVQLAQGVNTLVKDIEGGLTETARVVGSIAKGDMTQSMEGDFKGAFSDLQIDINQMVSSLKDLISDILESGATLGATAGELQDSSSGLSIQAEQNAAAIEETSAALEELTASLKQVSENVSEADENVRETNKTAETSSQVAEAAADAMNRIAEASKEISKVVSVINDIAFQINLLALNAGVEAARAGEAGQGFSVVAAEVRQLSQRASEAAKEIANVIEHSDTAVAEGVAKVADAQSSLAQISESVVGISNRIGDVASSIKEQVLGVSEINNAIAQVDQNTQRQAATSEELTASSSLLAGEAQNLLTSTARFDIGGVPVVTRPQASVPPPPPVAKEEDAPKPAPRIPAPASNLAVDEESWEDF